MPKAVRFNQYGGVDVLQVVEVERPTPGAGAVLVQVKAAGINPGEAKIREGALADRYPATFPSGEGSDFAGIVAQVGPGVTQFAVGAEVIGFTNNRASHAEYVVVPAEQLTMRPANVPWAAAGALFVAGATAYAAVHAVGLASGDTVVISNAGGGVGSIAIQLAAQRGAKVIGLAGPDHHAWLSAHGAIPVTYGDGAVERIHAAAGGPITAFIDAFGADYVEMALTLGVKPERIDTIANFAAVATYGVKAEGSSAGASATVLGELAHMISQGKLEIPIAQVYPLTEVRAAYEELEHGHTLGKIVLVP